MFTQRGEVCNSADIYSHIFGHISLLFSFGAHETSTFILTPTGILPSKEFYQGYRHIQDSQRGAPTQKGGGAQPIIWPKFCENYMRTQTL